MHIIRKRSLIVALTLVLTTAISVPFIANAAADKPMFTAKQMADWLHLVMATDRAVYTKVIVNRLTKKDKVITASEHF
ncbi:MAG: hypothetical protein ACI915_000115 [Gammaproteobacteria bacterium]|jgi:hypothetical protein